ncbi:MAG: hypothetical protein KAI24_09715 [Planctomycetes bacterium]|nr:hypothetical protein [Planctomycetota bacterium]
MSLLLMAPGLAACAGSGGGGTPGPAIPTSVMLVSRTSPTLALMSQGTPAPDAPNGNAMVSKVVDAAGMEALVATFEAEGMLTQALANVPSGARQALVMHRGGERLAWIYDGNARNPRTVAFARARSFFLQLFNHARNYVPADGAAGEMPEPTTGRTIAPRRTR